MQVQLKPENIEMDNGGSAALMQLTPQAIIEVASPRSAAICSMPASAEAAEVCACHRHCARCPCCFEASGVCTCLWTLMGSPITSPIYGHTLSIAALVINPAELRSQTRDVHRTATKPLNAYSRPPPLPPHTVEAMPPNPHPYTHLLKPPLCLSIVERFLTTLSHHPLSISFSQEWTFASVFYHLAHVCGLQAGGVQGGPELNSSSTLYSGWAMSEYAYQLSANCSSLAALDGRIRPYSA